MAKINGVQIKALKHTADHEGMEIYSGNIYVEGKMVATWRQDYMAGPDDYDFEKGYSYQKLNKMVIKFNKDKAEIIDDRDGNPITIDYELDIMLADLVKLIEDEKMYKKALKRGFGAFFKLTDGCHCASWFIPKGSTKEQVCEDLEEQIADFKAKCFKNREVEECFYSDAKDFEIGDEIYLNQIKGVD